MTELHGVSAHKPFRQALVLGDDLRSLLAVIRSLGRSGIRVHVAGHPSDSPARKSRYCYKQHTLPPYADNEESWCHSLTSIMQKEQFDLVIPCSDPFQIPLQRHRASLEPHGRIYLLDDNVFNTVSDKLKMNNLARAAGVPVPQEIIVRSAADITPCYELRLPVVLKPQSSYDLANVGARRSVKKAFTWQQFELLLREMLKEGVVAVQENFCGRGVGVEFLLDHGHPLLEFQHVRVHEPLHGGGSYYRKGVRVDPELRDAALRLLAPLGYTGVAMVEFKRNDRTGEWVFIEVNGRFWGSLPLAVASGADFPFALFNLLTKKQTEFCKSYRAGLYCRYWSGDVRWQIANLRADRSDPYLATSALSRVVLETFANVLSFRERSDTFAIDDPLPAADELYSLTRSLASSAYRKCHQAWLSCPPLRRHLRERALQALCKARRVVFVCKGNICRSPFAEEYARRLCGGEKEFVSAGYYPKGGRKCPPEAMSASTAMDIDLSGHRSQRLTPEILAAADVVFVFDYENYVHLLKEFKGLQRKLHLVGALAPGQPLWIDDPYGKDVQFFRDTYERIQSALRSGLTKYSDVAHDQMAPAAPK